jgi:hypothetical protein
MNKDLDARILPSGEYRDAQNVNVSKSEGEDVGSLENVLGNIEVTDFGLSNDCNLEVIGKIADVDNNRIFAMITNYTDTSADQLSRSAARYEFDNPAGGGFGYTSVLVPLKCCICVYDFNTNTGSVIVEGAFLNFSKTHQIHGIDLIEDQLFWTDNRNQPRKINVTTAINDNNYYFAEEHISVARYAPFLPISFIYNGRGTMLDTVREYLPDDTTSNPYKNYNWTGDEDFLEDKFVRFSYRLKFESNEYSLIAPFSQIAFIPQDDGYFIRRSDGNYGASVEIEKDTLSDTFRSTEVRFMQNKVTQITLKIPPITNTTNLSGWSNVDTDFKVKQVEILYKESNSPAVKVVEVLDVIDIVKPSTTLIDGNGNLSYTYNSTNPIKTLPNSQIVRVSDLAPVKAVAQAISGNRVIYGNFVDKHSYPSSLNYQVSVVDKDNDDAIEYPNHTLKQNRTYDVGVVLSDIYGRQSGVITSAQDGFSTIFHPYKEGSNNDSFAGFSDALAPTGDIVNWVGDILEMSFFEEIPEVTSDPNYPGIYSEFNPLGWFSYKIVVQQKEQEYYNVYAPGILNGYVVDVGGAPVPTPATTSNPTGHLVIHGVNINKIPRDLLEVGPEQTLFRSAKKKIKPSQEEFAASLFAGEISTRTPAERVQARIQARTDRRNEERELAIENAQRDTLENSSVKLYGRTTSVSYNDSAANNVQTNFPGEGYRKVKQFYPYNTNSLSTKNNQTIFDEIVTIAKQSDLELTGSWALDGDTNPLVGKIIFEDINIGAKGAPEVPNNGGNMLPSLSVYETEPFESQLDIYWESTQAGVITELNQDIRTNLTEAMVVLARQPDAAGFNCGVSEWPIIEFAEGIGTPTSLPYDIIVPGEDNLGQPTLYGISPFNFDGPPYIATLNIVQTASPGSLTLLQVTDGTGAIINNKFSLTSDGSLCGGLEKYRLKQIDNITLNSNPAKNEYYFLIEAIETTTLVRSSITVGPYIITSQLPTS